jgi:hypothetical protein
VFHSDLWLTLQANILELKTVIEQQQQNKEKLVITMSQIIQEKEQEVEEARREMRFAQTPNAQKELSEADKSALQYIEGKANRQEEILTSEMTVSKENNNFASIVIQRDFRFIMSQ